MMWSEARVLPVKQSSRLYSSSLIVSGSILSGLTIDVVGAELDEVEAAEDGRVLVLGAALEAEVLALDGEGEAGDLVVGQRHLHVRGEQADEGDDDGRGGAEARSGRRRRVQEEVESGARVGGDLLDRGLDQVERVAVGAGFLERHRGDRVEVQRLDLDLAILARPQAAVGVAVDRRAQHQAALLLGVGRHVSAAAGEADPERGPCPQDAVRAVVCLCHGRGTI